ncbi:DUF4397 domain-containing protein [Bacillus sp. NPDC077027]|uniref:DUF4397 domain-containing protein n=1 Tax=Bacillus sp. NPDC077027 TaxID=3390548 RepID=UPI003CFF178C
MAQQLLHTVDSLFYRPYPEYTKFHLFTASHRSYGYASIRLFHGAPDLSELAVFVNGEIVLNELSYSRLTSYMTWQEGVYEMEVFHLPTKEKVLFSRFMLRRDETYTLCLTGALTGFALLTEENSDDSVSNEQARLTFVQLSPDLPLIDLYERDSGILSKGLGYLKASQKCLFSPNKYHFELKASGTKSVLLDIPKVHLQTNRAYLILLHGFANGAPELMAKVVSSGHT